LAARVQQQRPLEIARHAVYANSHGERKRRQQSEVVEMVMTKPETIAHAVRGSDGQRYVCLGFEEAVSKARRLADASPHVQWSIVELIERPADEPQAKPFVFTSGVDPVCEVDRDSRFEPAPNRVCADSADGQHVLKQDGPFSVVYCDACGMNRGFRGDENRPGDV
jgi:hypothetical protein